MEEIAEPQLLRHAASTRVQYAHHWVIEHLDLPHALSAVAAVLLQNTRTCRKQPPRKLVVQAGGIAIEMRVGTPAEVPGAVQYLLHGHFQDHVGMHTDPRAARRDVSQQCVKHTPASSTDDGVDSHQHAVEAEKLSTHFIDGLVGIHRGLSVNALPGEGFEHSGKTRGGRNYAASGLAITAPRQSDPLWHITPHGLSCKDSYRQYVEPRDAISLGP